MLELVSKVSSATGSAMRAATSSVFAKKSSMYRSGYTCGFFARLPCFASHLAALATKLPLRPVLGIYLVLIASLAAGCASRAGTGAVVGGAVGAGAGAAIGSASNNTGAGAAIGGATGAVAGAVIGNARDQAEASSKEQYEFMRRQEEELKRQQRELEDLKRQKYHDDYFRSRYPEGEK